MWLERLTIVAAVCSSVAGAQAQARYGGFTLAAGPSVVGAASGFVSVESAPHLQLSAAHQTGPRLAVALGFDAFMMGSVVSIPSCAVPEGDIVGGSCEERTERAGTLLGLTLEARWYPWANGLGVSAGAGGFYAPSVHGPVASTGAALSAGAEYQLFSASSGVRPVIGVRASRLADVGGVRWTVAPTVGLRF